MKDKSKKKEYDRLRYIQNRDRISMEHRQWIETNREKWTFICRIGQRKWRAENRYKSRIMSSNRRKTVREGKVSFDIIDRLLEEQNYECAHSLWWCKADFLHEPFHLDHIMPLALGGKHEDNNIQLLCTACNLSKGPKHPDDFILQEMKRRIELRISK